MTRVFSDTRSATGERYFYDLETAPGAVHLNAPATLRITGAAPSVFNQVTVFRQPAKATLTLAGLPLISDVFISPAASALSAVGQVPSEYREIIVTNTMSPDYTEPRSTAPTVLFVNTLTPNTAALTMSYPQPNITQGGNIGFVSPSVGAVTVQGITVNLILSQPPIGSVTVNGLAPTIYTERRLQIGGDYDVEPPVQPMLTLTGLAPVTEAPFQWIDVDVPPPLTWTTSTGVTA